MTEWGSSMTSQIHPLQSDLFRANALHWRMDKISLDDIALQDGAIKGFIANRLTEQLKQKMFNTQQWSEYILLITMQVIRPSRIPDAIAWPTDTWECYLIRVGDSSQAVDGVAISLPAGLSEGRHYEVSNKIHVEEPLQERCTQKRYCHGGHNGLWSHSTQVPNWTVIFQAKYLLCAKRPWILEILKNWRWKSSLWKLVWKQLLLYLICFFAISFFYRFYL